MLQLNSSMAATLVPKTLSVLITLLLIVQLVTITIIIITLVYLVVVVRLLTSMTCQDVISAHQAVIPMAMEPGVFYVLKAHIACLLVVFSASHVFLAILSLMALHVMLAYQVTIAIIVRNYLVCLVHTLKDSLLSVLLVHRDPSLLQRLHPVSLVRLVHFITLTHLHVTNV